MTDYRALCKELLAALEIQLDELRFNNRLCIRARAALAAEAEGEELRFDGGYESGSMWTGHPLRPAALAAEPVPPDVGEVAELVAWLWSMHELAGECNPEEQCRYERAADLLERLAPQPVPEGLSDGPAVQSREPASVSEEPTDEDIIGLMPQQMHDDLAAAARALAGTENKRVRGIMRIMLNRHAVDHARAVLDRWGQ